MWDRYNYSLQLKYLLVRREEVNLVKLNLF